MAKKKRKTKAEKVKTSYRIDDFVVREEEMVTRMDDDNFGYLSKEYIGKDISKTVLFSVVIVLIIVFLSRIV